MARFQNRLEDKNRDIRLLVRQLETRHCIIAGFDIEHHLMTTGDYPAWSSGNQIYFNSAKLPRPNTAQNIVRVTGVGYHELAHVFFTPTLNDMGRVWPSDAWAVGNPMIQALKSNPLYGQAFNVLEDQRIEGLLLRRYRRMKPYLVDMFLGVVMAGATDESYETLYSLVRGRRYLSKRFRRMVRKRFKDQKIVRPLSRIIDEYCTLNLTRLDGMRRAHELINQYLKLMEDAGLSMPHVHTDCGGIQQVKIASAFDNSSRSKEQDSSAIDQEAAKVAVDIKTENAQDDEAKNDTDPASGKAPGKAEGKADGEGDGQDGQGQGDGAADGDSGAAGGSGGAQGQGNGPNGAQGASGAGENGTGGDPGDGEGGGDGAGTGESGKGAGAGADDVSDIKAEAAAQREVIIQDVNVQSEVADIRKVMRQASALSSDIDRQTDWGSHVPEELIGISNRIAKELQRLEVDTDPYWDRRVNSGRLNIQRVMLQEQDPEQMFDRWQEGGLGGNDQEWVVLLDMSSSMRSLFPEMNRAAWVMKRAADKMGAKMTILCYGSRNNRTCVYDANQRAKTNQFPLLKNHSNTEPLYAIMEAQAVLMSSERSIKGLMLMTDGHFGGFRSQYFNGVMVSDDALVRQMGKAGVVTCLTYMHSSPGGYGKGDKHGANLYEEVNRVQDLPQVMRKLIAAQMRTAKI